MQVGVVREEVCAEDDVPGQRTVGARGPRWHHVDIEVGERLILYPDSAQPATISIIESKELIALKDIECSSGKHGYR